VALDTLNGEALTGLTTALQSLLPASADPNLAPELLVSPKRFSPAGLNGFVGVNHDPEGDILGRRVSAIASVGVKTKTLATLGDAVAGVTAAVVGAPRSDLRRLGILSVGVTELGPQTAPAPGPQGVARQQVTFDVSYEFLKLPAAPAGVIAQIPLDLELSGENDPRRLYSDEFNSQSLASFEIVDDPLSNKNTPSAWAFDAVGLRVAQTKAIFGGGTAVNANKPGTYAVLRGTPSHPPVADFILRAEVQSDSDQGIGLVFRYADADNFAFFLANQNGGYRVLGRKIGGAFQQVAVDATRGYTVGALMRLKVVASDTELRASVDDGPALIGVDPVAPAPGRVGLAAQRNNQAFFYGMELIAI
jgi:hypothetical protein